MAEFTSQIPKEEEEYLVLPPGFRFHPTDEEIITNYLSEKIADKSFSALALGEVDLNKCEPWDLPNKAKMGEKEWYFFTQKEKRYPTGMRTNRATESGYWKATGKDKEIYKSKGSVLVGMKKTLVFYRGRAPKGEKTNWVMHEFRLEGNHSHLYNLSTASKEDWVVVRVLHKNEAAKKNPSTVQESACFAHPCTSSLSYLQQDEAMERATAPVNANARHNSSSMSPFIGQRKIEQFSSSMATTSHDTGLSNDWNAEISSYDYGLSSGPFFDLENIWNYKGI
ncbi:uncharacterized protein A4U43_C02F15280 [Asparagus officinalis]|uniref:NAC domain-containing protein n=1 Tax=Asparagus officinalis TaxID=4686 RepID=A0A5P1FJB1_ASPOF|nr:NAC domain-containing protein 100-like [Asparagus officinalis]ONK78174.1 uncharacterized protein A4U43_C02F15280 [Asparagus officinalis]